MVGIIKRCEWIRGSALSIFISGSTCHKPAKRLFLRVMSTLTLDQTSRIESLLAAGELVFLSKAGKKLGVIIPAVEKAHGVPLPDFRARLRQTWGSRVFSDDEVKAMREAEIENCHS
ncbi:hypothetical protein [Prosthecobacter sp.]|uniref:hypothetical protein n=1 Tax=Prosthecobacter sp. TaxID=1965333 RepID=UPI0037C7C953